MVFTYLTYTHSNCLSGANAGSVPIQAAQHDPPDDLRDGPVLLHRPSGREGLVEVEAGAGHTPLRCDLLCKLSVQSKFQCEKMMLVRLRLVNTCMILIHTGNTCLGSRLLHASMGDREERACLLGHDDADNLACHHHSVPVSRRAGYPGKVRCGVCFVVSSASLPAVPC
jgi:hypothetical protein